MSKRIFMIAGPNGAGKTTMILTLLPDMPTLYEFINADEIARGLAPLHTETVSIASGKLMIKRLLELLEAGQSFAFETTGAGTNYLKYLKEAKAAGYEVNLMYLWLSSPEQAIKRVAQRVIQGGHNVSGETVQRRYYAGLKNLFKYYLPLADSVIVLDNSMEKSHRVVARKNMATSLEIYNANVWNEIKKRANEEVR